MNRRPQKSDKKSKSLQTFTYFIPAPPHRKTGYREKEFDKIMRGILQSGLILESIQTTAVDQGLFVLALLRAPSKKIADLDLHLDIQEKFKLSHTHSSPDIVLDDEDA